jgi:WD40 repeat protein
MRLLQQMKNIIFHDSVINKERRKLSIKETLGIFFLSVFIFGCQSNLALSKTTPTPSTRMEFFGPQSPDNTLVLVRYHDSANSCLYSYAIHNLGKTRNDPIELKPGTKETNCSIFSVDWSPDGSMIVMYSSNEPSLFILDNKGNSLMNLPLKLAEGESIEALTWISEGVFYTLYNQDKSELHKLEIQPPFRDNILLTTDSPMYFVSSDPTNKSRLLLVDVKNFQLIIYNIESETIEKTIPDCIAFFSPRSNSSSEGFFVNINCFKDVYAEDMVFNWQTERIIKYEE